MTAETVHESNIFGESIQTSTAPGTEQASVATTTAGKIIDHIKYIADSNITQATDRADWLSIAAESGQNTGDKSLVRKPIVEPDKIDSSKIVTGWKLPDLPALLTLPALPDALKVDTTKIKADWQADVDALKNSWMAQFLPAATDLTPLNALFSKILDGTAQASFETRLNSLEAATTAALAAVTTSSLASLTSLAATVQGNIDANIVTQKGNIASAIALAQDNTQQIAWQRMRDQVARESKRLEDEAASRFASAGFSLPGGVLVNQIQERRQATLAAASDAAAQEAVRIQQAFIDLAKSTIDTWARTMEIQSRAEMERYRAQSDANLKYAEMQLDANKFNADLAVKHLGLTLDFTKFAAETAVKYRLGVIDGMNNLIRAFASLRESETEYVRAVSLASQQAFAALVEYYRAAMSSAEIGLRVEMANNENSIRYAGVAAEFIGRAVANHVQAAGQAAQSFAHIAGMAISGMNAIGQVSATE